MRRCRGLRHSDSHARGARRHSRNIGRNNTRHGLRESGSRRTQARFATAQTRREAEKWRRAAQVAQNQLTRDLQEFVWLVRTEPAGLGIKYLTLILALH